MIRLLLLSTFTVFVLWGCEEIEDPAGEAGPPEIKVDFEARESKDTTAMLFDSLSARVGELGLLLDSLREESPNDTVPVWQELDRLIPVRDSLEAVNDLFQRGQVRLDSLIAIGGNYVEEYQDTVNAVFSLPLNIHSDSSAFVFMFHGLVDTIVFNYRKEVASGLDKVLVVASNVSARNTNPKVEILRYTCKDENCTSSEITYKAYF